MLKRVIISLLFLATVFSTTIFVSSALPNVYCDDGSQNCVHDDYSSCLISQIDKQGCWSQWGMAGVTTCQRAEIEYPNLDQYWYSNNYGGACSYWNEPNTKSCVENPAGTAQCLTDCFKLGGFCTLNPLSSVGKYKDINEGDTFCDKILKNSNAECIKCGYTEYGTFFPTGEPIGNVPYQTCYAPDVKLEVLGGNYYGFSTSASGNAYAKTNLVSPQGSRYELCKIKWKQENDWRYTSPESYSIYGTFKNTLLEDKYTINGNYLVQLECIGKAGEIKSDSRTLTVGLVADGVCNSNVVGRGYNNRSAIITAGPCSQGNFGQITLLGDEWKWTCSGTNNSQNCSATLSETLCLGPEPSDVCQGRTISKFDENGIECGIVEGTSTDPTCDECTNLLANPPKQPNEICGIPSPPNKLPIKTSSNKYCGEIIGTKNCTSSPACPTTIDASTICSYDFGYEIDANRDLCLGPIWGTEDCSSEQCSFTSARWDVPTLEVAQGTDVVMIVGGTEGCSGKTINYEIYREAGATDQKVGNTISKVWGQPPIWTAQWINVGTLNPKYYFKATLSDNPSVTIQSASNKLLEVLKSSMTTAQCKVVFSCGDYSEAQCRGDPCRIEGEDEKLSFLEGTKLKSQLCYQSKAYTCGWDSTNNICRRVADINIFDEGCPSVVAGGSGYPDSVGLCSYTETTTDDCTDGVLNVKWSGIWEWAEGNEDGEDYGERAICIAGGTRNVPCASSVSLNFFTVKNVILVVVLIILFYILINLGKKRPVKKVSRKTKKKKRR